MMPAAGENLAGTKTNRFDNLAVDIRQIYASNPYDLKTAAGESKPLLIRSRLHTWIYANRLIPLKLRRHLWDLARQTQLDLTWFKEFKAYWSKVLGGRPLWGVQDFYFLRNLYRMRFQNTRLPESAETGDHLRTWQQPEIIGQFFHSVYKESLRNSVHKLNLMRRHHEGPVRSFMEFGCATAPITASLYEFFPHLARKTQSYICDIQTLAFHYAAHRFRAARRVTPVMLRPENDFLPHSIEKMDVIFCVTVFEHLNEPLKTAEHFYRMLNPGGLLIFDYIRSGGEGLDTRRGVLERDAVLDYVDKHFEILHGKIDRQEHLKLSVARKRSCA